MEYRRFGRTQWRVSEIGYGMWGMGGWSGSNDDESLQALHRAIELGCNFFDTAWVYGNGHSERLLGRVIAAKRGRESDASPTDSRPRSLVVATKIPPKNMRWPASPASTIGDTYPPDHIREYTEKSLDNLGVSVIDLQQFHVWSDSWSDDDGWKRAVEALKREGLVRAFGISVNRWEPANVLRALASGVVDTVQVVYNIFDQAPEDELFAYCESHDIAVIARVPFDEGILTGTLTRDSMWPEGDWRNMYFTRDNLRATLDRVEQLEPLRPEGMSLPDLALRFILAHPTVSTTIPGMRRVRHVEQNLAAAGQPLPPRLRDALRAHRWDRTLRQAP